MINDYRQYFPKLTAKKLARYIDIERYQELLPFRIRLLTLIAACQSFNKPKILKGLLRWALKSDIDPKEIYEVLLQNYLFIGYPRVIESFFIFNEIIEKSGEYSRDNKELADYDLFEVRGLRIARCIYGKNFDLVYDNIKNLCPDLALGMVIEGYGRIISRPGLDILARELAIVAVLTVASMPRQLYSHVKGSLSVGADPGQIEAVIRQCGFFIKQSKIDRAILILEKVLGNSANPR